MNPRMGAVLGVAWLVMSGSGSLACTALLGDFAVGDFESVPDSGVGGDVDVSGGAASQIYADAPGAHLGSAAEGGIVATQQGGSGAPTCRPAECDSPICSPSTYSCLGAELRRCGEDGQSWATLETCSDAAHCSASATGCLICDANEYRCDGGVLEKCNATRTGWFPVDICASSALCSTGLNTCQLMGATQCNCALL